MRPLPSRSEMERAFLASDTSYDGVFTVAVRTTGIFCRPSCPARKPLPGNIEFFPTVGDALAAGYRACLRCRPLDSAGAAPAWVTRMLDLMARHPDRRITGADLRTLGVDPGRARREFSRRFGMTFHAYARARRVGRALDQLRLGGDLDEAVFESGFRSHSGFREAFHRLAGEPPGRAGDIGRVSLTWFDTALGGMIAGAIEDAVCLLEFTDRPLLRTQLGILRRRFRAVLVPGESPHLARLRDEVGAYFSGALRQFSVPLVTPGTPFEERVWAELRRIPYGETRTYQDLARALGDGDAQRAVGRANGYNRVAVVIPCHRVIGRDGALVGYGGGLWRKRLLLHLERTGEPLQPPAAAGSVLAEGGEPRVPVHEDTAERSARA